MKAVALEEKEAPASRPAQEVETAKDKSIMAEPSAERKAHGRAEKKERPKCPLPFIPSWLDNAGLTPDQFRVYCKISRRGDCFESVGTMARGCDIGPKRVRAALDALESRGLIQKEPKRHPEWHTNIFRVVKPPKDGLWPIAKTAMAKTARERSSPPEGSPGKEGRKGKGSTASSLLSKEEKKKKRRPQHHSEPSEALEIRQRSVSAPPRSDPEAQCWQIAQAEGLDPAFVKSFIALHQRDGWTIRGRPIQSVPSALRKWCAATERNWNELLESMAEGTDGDYGNAFRRRCFESAQEYALDPGFVDDFIDRTERGHGCIPNPATGELEPIRDLIAALMAFCDKCEEDRHGH